MPALWRLVIPSDWLDGDGHDLGERVLSGNLWKNLNSNRTNERPTQRPGGPAKRWPPVGAESERALGQRAIHSHHLEMDLI